VNEGCKEIKKHHIPIDSGFIFTCVKNKILDVVRRMGTAANRTLSYAVRNRTYCAVLKPEGDPEDTFDYQTTKTLSQREEEMCQ
jgi:DNA-directed RNA polymerase specialized sigma24 family protein